MSAGRHPSERKNGEVRSALQGTINKIQKLADDFSLGGTEGRPAEGTVVHTPYLHPADEANAGVPLIHDCAQRRHKVLEAVDARFAERVAPARRDLLKLAYLEREHVQRQSEVDAAARECSSEAQKQARTVPEILKSFCETLGHVDRARQKRLRAAGQIKRRASNLNDDEEFPDCNTLSDDELMAAVAELQTRVRDCENEAFDQLRSCSARDLFDCGIVTLEARSDVPDIIVDSPNGQEFDGVYKPLHSDRVNGFQAWTKEGNGDMRLFSADGRWGIGDAKDGVYTRGRFLIVSMVNHKGAMPFDVPDVWGRWDVNKATFVRDIDLKLSMVAPRDIAVDQASMVTYLRESIKECDDRGAKFREAAKHMKMGTLKFVDGEPLSKQVPAEIVSAAYEIYRDVRKRVLPDLFEERDALHGHELIVRDDAALQELTRECEDLAARVECAKTAADVLSQERATDSWLQGVFDSIERGEELNLDFFEACRKALGLVEHDESEEAPIGDPAGLEAFEAGARRELRNIMADFTEHYNALLEANQRAKQLQADLDVRTNHAAALKHTIQLMDEQRQLFIGALRVARGGAQADGGNETKQSASASAQRDALAPVSPKEKQSAQTPKGKGIASPPVSQKGSGLATMQGVLRARAKFRNTGRHSARVVSSAVAATSGTGGINAGGADSTWTDAFVAAGAEKAGGIQEQVINALRREDGRLDVLCAEAERTFEAKLWQIASRTKSVSEEEFRKQMAQRAAACNTNTERLADITDRLWNICDGRESKSPSPTRVDMKTSDAAVKIQAWWRGSSIHPASGQLAAPPDLIADDGGKRQMAAEGRHGGRRNETMVQEVFRLQKLCAKRLVRLRRVDAEVETLREARRADATARALEGLPSDSENVRGSRILRMEMRRLATKRAQLAAERSLASRIIRGGNVNSSML